MEGLGHELLDLAGAGHSDLVVLGKLIHTQDGNDVLKILVILESLLDRTGKAVVLLADNARVEHTGGGVERVNSGVDTELSNATGQHSGGVQVGEGGGGSRVSQIVGRHVDSLNRGDGALLVGGDALLETTKIGSQSRLVTHSRGDTAEKGRHLGVGLGETENVVDEEKHVLALLVTEVLSNGETGEGDTGAGTGRLVHLAVHEGGLGAGAIELDHARLDHLVVEIVTLTGTLTNTGEHGVTTVGLGDVVDQLHDQHSLADTGTTEETNLATLGIRRKEVNNLDAGHKNLSLGGLLGESGGISVDGLGHLGGDGAALVDGLADNVDDAAEELRASRHHDGGAGVLDLLATHKTLGGVHSNGAHGVLTEMLGDLENQADRVPLDLKGVQNGRELAIELHVNDGTDNLRNLADGKTLGGRASRGGSGELAVGGSHVGGANSDLTPGDVGGQNTHGGDRPPGQNRSGHLLHVGTIPRNLPRKHFLL
mmetsp:Transcript_2542/g.6973  ORF Transcript_2542/g.6973 Transcript_2542/m.6973 type:complete len:483 (-) Transcript_2542:25-1473(-)